MPRSPFYQGELDGLCGMSSIVNVYRHLLAKVLDREDADDLFRITLKSIPQGRYPDVIIDGTSFADLKRMAIAAKDWANERLADSPYRVRLRYPFQRVSIRKMETFWETFDAELNDDVYGAAIFGLTEPWHHWVCVYKSDSSRIHFYDSDGSDARKNRSSIGLAPFTSPNKFRLDYKSTIIIKVDKN